MPTSARSYKFSITYESILRHLSIIIKALEEGKQFVDATTHYFRSHSQHEGYTVNVSPISRTIYSQRG
jgi:hypothetical protein